MAVDESLFSGGYIKVNPKAIPGDLAVSIQLGSGGHTLGGGPGGVWCQYQFGFRGT